MNVLSYTTELQVTEAQRQGSEEGKAHQPPEKCFHRGGRSLAGPCSMSQFRGVGRDVTGWAWGEDPSKQRQTEEHVATWWTLGKWPWVLRDEEEPPSPARTNTGKLEWPTQQTHLFRVKHPQVTWKDWCHRAGMERWAGFCMWHSLEFGKT